MKFADTLLSLLKRIAQSEVAHESVRINDDGVFQIDVYAVMEDEVAKIGSLTEHATEIEITQFELQLDLLDNAVRAQDAEDAEREILIHEILSRLTPEERLLIERPLPEDLPPEDECEEHY